MQIYDDDDDDMLPEKALIQHPHLLTSWWNQSRVEPIFLCKSFRKTCQFGVSCSLDGTEQLDII